VKVQAKGAALALLVAACGLSTDPTGDPGPQEASRLEVRAGDDVTVPGTVLRVHFVGVQEDSRCPVDVVCVWQGNAAVAVGLAAGSGPSQPYVLNTGVEPTSVDLGGTRLTLVGLAPEPRQGTSIPLEDYVVTLGVEPSPN